MVPANQKAKHCRHCNQLIPVNIFSQHLRDMHKETVQFPCLSCTATFSRESNFRSHMEKHIAKSKSAMAEAGGQGGHTPSQITQIIHMEKHIAESKSGMAEAGGQGGHTQIMVVPGSCGLPH